MPQRVYLSAFPKAGTHLCERWVRQLAAPAIGRPWYGNITDNAWGAEWKNDAAHWHKVFSNLPGGSYLKGHAGHTSDYARVLWDCGVCTIFVYRNLRDVAVSAAYHIMSNRKNRDGSDVLAHPGRAAIRSLGGFDAVLLAVIRGVEQYVGIADRWRMYQGWLSERWVLHLPYEDMVLEPGEAASRLTRYVIGQTASFYGHKASINRKAHDDFVASMLAASDRKTTTYRRGVAGGWVDDWSDAAERAFQETGAAAMNAELGYE